jgi:SAM-dependent methyltransferase
MTGLSVNLCGGLQRAAMTNDVENIGLNDAIDALEGLSNYRDWILDEFGSALRGHTVEIGGGSGNISEKLRTRVPTVDIVEPSRELSERLTRRLGGHANVSIRNESAEGYLAAATPDSCDTIIMVSVLEHIEDDADALVRMHAALRPGGCVLLFVPALMFLFSKLDFEHGHFRRYGKAELVGKVRAAGFEVVAAKYMDLLGMAPWLLFNKWMRKTEFDPRMVGIYDRFGIPLTRAGERLLGSPLGKNVMVIGRKPDGPSA